MGQRGLRFLFWSFPGPQHRAQGSGSNTKFRGYVSGFGSFQALSLGHKAKAQTRSLGGYVSDFGGFQALIGRGPHKTCRGLLFLFWWSPGPKLRAQDTKV